VIRFNSDLTLRWACRAGDYIIWARFSGYDRNLGLLDPRRSNTYKPADIWQLGDGNFVTITNRHADFPEWFNLHPREAAGSFVLLMMNRLKQGYEPPLEPMTAPNIWRVFSGDRIAWVGSPRAGVSQTEILGLVDFRGNALVYGEPIDFDTSGEVLTILDRFSQLSLSPEGIRLCRAGWEAIKGLGYPRDVWTDDEWRIG
jgi:hypothetical protein